MPILKYTTSISAQKTVGEIMRILANHGAKAILTNYDDAGQVESLSFQIATPQGDIGIRLPVDPDAALKVMSRQGVTNKYLNRAHATRVAWRIVKHWVEAQMAIVETEMVRAEQVFLPYMMVDGNHTLYDAMKEKHFLLNQGENNAKDR